MKLMHKTPKLVGWLAKQLGDYPFSVTGGLVTALDPGFALENQTRPTYPSVGAGATLLVVHEQAHQWFGDSVSVENWRDIWLNEGAATFMEVRYEETHGGQSANQWLRNRYDRPDSDPFWDLRIGNPGANHIFDGEVYYRGGMALQALRNRVGEDAFWTILRTWVAERANGNGSTDDFQALAEEESGENLTGFFEAWFFTGEKPADTADNGLADPIRWSPPCARHGVSRLRRSARLRTSTTGAQADRQAGHAALELLELGDVGGDHAQAAGLEELPAARGAGRHQHRVAAEQHHVRPGLLGDGEELLPRRGVVHERLEADDGPVRQRRHSRLQVQHATDGYADHGRAQRGQAARPAARRPTGWSAHRARPTPFLRA